jgi:general secretion pathway protein M
MKEQWIKLKEWWLSLAIREQQALTIGGAALSIFIIYQFVWAPFTDHVSILRQQITSKEKLWAWMEKTDKQIQDVQSRTKGRGKVLSPVVCLSFLQKKIQQARLESHLSQLRQVSADSIEMHFQKVEFDKFIRLLTRVVMDQGIAVSQLSIRIESTPGIVTADVMFRIFS